MWVFLKAFLQRDCVDTFVHSTAADAGTLWGNLALVPSKGQGGLSAAAKRLHILGVVDRSPVASQLSQRELASPFTALIQLNLTFPESL